MGGSFVRCLIALLPLFLLPACATIVKGSSQDITVNSSPSAAMCQIAKGSASVVTIESTPAIAKISRGSDALTVTCTKAGYDKTAVTMTSSFNGATFGNILLGGIVGVVVDASTGANYTYQDQVTVTLPPSGPVAPVGPIVPGPYVPGSPIKLSPQQPGA